MSCEKQGELFYIASLIDGAVEEVHFKPVEEILTSIPKLTNIELESMGAGIKRTFVPFLTDVNMTGL